MKPTIQIATTKAPDGTNISLYEHDGDYAIYADRQQLMSSRQHESECELARLGCERIASHRAPTLLIGGLGMGYSLRQALDLLSPKATIVVSELLPDIIRWNREIIGSLCDHPIRDSRVSIENRDVLAVMKASPATFDAILLDVDNGPHAFTTDSNQALYTASGIRTCMRSLHSKGCLAIWSAGKDKRFEQLLRHMQLHVKAYPAAASKSSKRFSRWIWVASRDPHALP
jgi:spermidine synthase